MVCLAFVYSPHLGVCLTPSGPLGHWSPENVPLYCNKHYHLHTASKFFLWRFHRRRAILMASWWCHIFPHAVPPGNWHLCKEWAPRLSCWVWVKIDRWEGARAGGKAGNPSQQGCHLGRSMPRKRALHRSRTAHHWRHRASDSYPTRAHFHSLQIFFLGQCCFCPCHLSWVHILVLRAWKSQCVPCSPPPRLLHIIVS